MAEIKKSKLEGVLLIKQDVFRDHRGLNGVLYKEDEYYSLGVNIKFVQDNFSVSIKNVLRGIHGDEKTWKLVSCLYGEIYLVVVKCDRNSHDFGRWESFILSDKNRYQVLIPPKYGNAHLVLSDWAVFHYKLSEYYDRDTQFTYRFDDPRFKINWPIKNPILSPRDEQAKYIE